MILRHIAQRALMLLFASGAVAQFASNAFSQALGYEEAGEDEEVAHEGAGGIGDPSDEQRPDRIGFVPPPATGNEDRDCEDDEE